MRTSSELAESLRKISSKRVCMVTMNSRLSVFFSRSDTRVGLLRNICIRCFSSSYSHFIAFSLAAKQLNKMTFIIWVVSLTHYDSAEENWSLRAINAFTILISAKKPPLAKKFTNHYSCMSLNCWTSPPLISSTSSLRNRLCSSLSFLISPFHSRSFFWFIVSWQPLGGPLASSYLGTS